jgi:hypothetical protein
LGKIIEKIDAELNGLFWRSKTLCIFRL